MLDDFSPVIVAWKLCATMKRRWDVTATLDLALAASGLDQMNVVHRPRLLSDSSSSYQYVASDLAGLAGQARRSSMSARTPTIRRPKVKSSAGIKRSRTESCLSTTTCPAISNAKVAAFVAHYNHARYHESLDNLTPADDLLVRRVEGRPSS